MLCQALGGEVIFFSLLHFIAPALDLLPGLQARGTRDCHKGSKFKKGVINCCYIIFLIAVPYYFITITQLEKIAANFWINGNNKQTANTQLLACRTFHFLRHDSNVIFFSLIQTLFFSC